jgi:type I restriction enzyme R subunit
VLSFHIDYFGKDSKDQKKPKKGETPPPEAVIKEILKKHDAATNSRRFNAILATASINNAIEYYELFKALQTQKLAVDDGFQPLNIACVFSPPTQALAKDNDNQNGKNVADIKQLQDDLSQEKVDNQEAPEQKKAVLMAIIADYNQQYGTNHNIIPHAVTPADFSNSWNFGFKSIFTC